VLCRCADFLFPESVAYASGNLQEGAITPRCTSDDGRQVAAYLLPCNPMTCQQAASFHDGWTMCCFGLSRQPAWHMVPTRVQQCKELLLSTRTADAGIWYRVKRSTLMMILDDVK
jgi:hypothetical protein